MFVYFFCLNQQINFSRKGRISCFWHTQTHTRAHKKSIFWIRPKEVITICPEIRRHIEQSSRTLTIFVVDPSIIWAKFGSQVWCCRDGCWYKRKSSGRLRYKIYDRKVSQTMWWSMGKKFQTLIRKKRKKMIRNSLDMIQWLSS